MCKKICRKKTEDDVHFSCENSIFENEEIYGMELHEIADSIVEVLIHDKSKSCIFKIERL